MSATVEGMALMRCTCLWASITAPAPRRSVPDPFCPAVRHCDDPVPATVPDR
jgi:hypothetical protein